MVCFVIVFHIFNTQIFFVSNFVLLLFFTFLIRKVVFVSNHSTGLLFSAGFVSKFHLFNIKQKQHTHTAKHENVKSESRILIVFMRNITQTKTGFETVFNEFTIRKCACVFSRHKCLLHRYYLCVRK